MHPLTVMEVFMAREGGIKKEILLSMPLNCLPGSLGKDCPHFEFCKPSGQPSTS